MAESHEVSIQSSNTLQSKANVSCRSKFQQLLWGIISTRPTIDQRRVNLERKAGLVTNIVVIHLLPQQTSVWDSKPQNLSCFPTTQDGDMLNYLEFFLFPHCLPASKIPAASLTLFWNHHYQLIIVLSVLGFCGDKMRKNKVQYQGESLGPTVFLPPPH